MNQKPLVSIIIPCYNHARFLSEVIESVTAQTYQNWECIIVNDGSTDNTSEVARQLVEIYKYQNIQILEKQNSGPIESRNLGVLNSSGKFILFLDADDKIHPNFIEETLEILLAKPDIGFVYTDVQHFGANNDLVIYGDFVPEHFLQSNSAPVTSLFRKEIFDRVGGMKQDMLLGSEDWEFWISCYEKGWQGYRLAKPYLYYRQHQSGSRLQILRGTPFGPELMKANVINLHQKLYSPQEVLWARSMLSKYGKLLDNDQSLPKLQQTQMKNNDVRLIAFYLPQYHPIPENDRWWGKGFTEWTNVTKARQNFEGHYQPHLPADLGFYDLRVFETRIEQARLAKEYGISGFCYYYYWFGGKKLLNRPFDDLLASKEPDFPFCVCWANENWTRRWDGREHEVLISQNHSLEDDKNFIHNLIPAFSDDRYIRVNGKPLLMVYRLGLLPNPAQTAQVWREECRKSGIEDIYLCAVQSFDNCDPRIYGFDAAIEFPPVGIDKKEVSHQVRITNPNFQGCIWDYEQVITSSLNKPEADYKLFKTVMPSWDNAPRRQERAHTFINSTPENYEFWLSQVIEKTKQRYEGDERLVFINAWNEWGEGCHLEPDQKYGHQFLKATKNALISPKLEHSISENLQTTAVEYPDIKPVSGVSNRPKWSVMIPSYNSNPKYLEKTLKSILEQDLGCEEMQIEVVDDRSTQYNPEELVRKIGQGRVSFYRHPKNLGLIGNWNACIDRAHGHLIHILHQDDVVKPGFYSRLQAAFEQEPTIGAAFCRYFYMDEKGRERDLSPLERETPGVIPNWIERIAVTQRIECPSIVVKREVYEKLGGFCPEVHYAADWEMWKRIAAHYSVWYEPELLASYRSHSLSETSRLIKSGANIADTRKAIEISQSYLPATIAAELSYQARENCAFKALHIARQMLSKGDIDAAIAQIREGIKSSQSSNTIVSMLDLVQEVVRNSHQHNLLPLDALILFLPAFQEPSQRQQAIALIENLKLRETNLIIFPDWSQPEDLLYQDLACVMTSLMNYPDRNQITLLIDRGNLTEDEATLFISGVVMNLVMEEGLDVADELEISLVGQLNEMQWQVLSSRINARIVLEHENQQAIAQSKVEKIPTYEISSFSELTSVLT